MTIKLRSLLPLIALLPMLAANAVTKQETLTEKNVGAAAMPVDIAELRQAAVPSLWVLCSSYLLTVPAFVCFQSVSGTGNTKTALVLEMSALAIYVAYITYIISYHKCDIAVAWTSEYVYSISILLFSLYYLQRGNWSSKKI